MRGTAYCAALNRPAGYGLRAKHAHARALSGLFDGNQDDTCTYHSQGARRAWRHINDPTVNERATVIDATSNGMTGVSNGGHATEGASSVRACHFAA
jgi:hypothetical protein